MSKGAIGAVLLAFAAGFVLCAYVHAHYSGLDLLGFSFSLLSVAISVMAFLDGGREHTKVDDLVKASSQQGGILLTMTQGRIDDARRTGLPVTFPAGRVQLPPPPPARRT